VWVLHGVSVTRCECYTVWVLHGVSVTRCECYTVWVLHGVSVTRCECYTVWVLHGVSVTRCECYTVWVLHGVAVKVDKFFPNLFLTQLLSVRGWTSAFLLEFYRLCSAIERRLSHFLPCTLAQDGLAECDQPGKNPSRYFAGQSGIELRPPGAQTVRYIHSPTEISWLVSANQCWKLRWSHHIPAEDFSCLGEIQIG